MKQIDTRGLSCPEPVIRATGAVNAMKQGEQLEILIETGAARDNVLRALQSCCCETETNACEGGEFRVLVTKK